MSLAKPTAAIIAYLLFTATMLAVIEPEGLGGTLGTAAARPLLGTLALVLVKRIDQKGLATVFGGTGD